MVDAQLGFDAFARRWEYVIAEFSEWSDLTRITPLLGIGRTADGALAGFLFDHDPDSPDFAASLEEIDRLFGTEVRSAVTDAPSTDTNTMIATTRLADSPIIPAELNAGEILPTSTAVNARASDVEIIEDTTRRTVTVTMTLPWWARFLRPWVTVRRRGRAEILAVAPLRFKGRRASAQARYGLPNGTASLVADVVKGPRRPLITVLLALILTALLVIGGRLAFGAQQESMGVDSAGTDADAPVAVTDSTSPTTTIATDTTVATATTLAVPTTLDASTASGEVVAGDDDAVSTTVRPRRSTTTSSTILVSGGISFEVPDQYVSVRNKYASLGADRTTIPRGETLKVRVRVTGIDINNFERGSANNLAELVSLCRETIGIPATFVPIAGWAPVIEVALRGTEVRAGGLTQLFVVGNIARECGDTLVTSSPLRINVVRMTYYREVEFELPIPRSIVPGNYQLDLLPFDTLWQKETPLRITVTE